MVLDTLVFLFVDCGDAQSWVTIKITTGSSPGSEMFSLFHLNLQQTNGHKWFYGEGLGYVFRHSVFLILPLFLSWILCSGGFFSKLKALHRQSILLAEHSVWSRAWPQEVCACRDLVPWTESASSVQLTDGVNLKNFRILSVSRIFLSLNVLMALWKSFFRWSSTLELQAELGTTSTQGCIALEVIRGVIRMAPVDMTHGLLLLNPGFDHWNTSPVP